MSTSILDFGIGLLGRTSVVACFLLATSPVMAQTSSDGCALTYCPEDSVYQLAPGAGFAKGLFKGPTTYGALLKLGDVGLGALNPVDGEVIAVDGVAYHANLKGRVTRLPLSAGTPFGFFKRFREDRRVSLPAVNGYEELLLALDAQIGSPNRFFAARIDGDFEYLKLRSVPRQKEPYPPIDAVIANQKVYEVRNVRGTMIAFRFPAYLGGINAEGWHIHFVDEARRLGGHLLDLRTTPLVVRLDESRSLTLLLPDDAAFDQADFSATRGSEAGSSDPLKRAIHPR